MGRPPRSSSSSFSSRTKGRRLRYRLDLEKMDMNRLTFVKKVHGNIFEDEDEIGANRDSYVAFGRGTWA
jgi:hypothetical protein